MIGQTIEPLSPCVVKFRTQFMRWRTLPLRQRSAVCTNNSKQASTLTGFPGRPNTKVVWSVLPVVRMCQSKSLARLEIDFVKDLAHAKLTQDAGNIVLLASRHRPSELRCQHHEELRRLPTASVPVRRGHSRLVTFNLADNASPSSTLAFELRIWPGPGRTGTLGSMISSRWSRSTG